MKSYGDIKVVPFGRVICCIVCMLWINNLYTSLSDKSGLRCGSSFVACIRHSCSNSVICRRKFSFVLLRWIPPAIFRRNSVRIVGDLTQSCCVILGICSAPPYYAKMWCINLLYIVSNLHWSLSAFLSCSPVHRKYVFFNENASRPKSSWRSWVITFAVHLGSPHIVFWILIIFLSNFLMVGSEYGTA